MTNYNDTEQRLLKELLILFKGKGMDNEDAKEMSKKLLDDSIKESKETGLYDLPLNFGDIILGNASANDINVERLAEIIRKSLPQKKDEGVQNEDVRLYWNLPNVERVLANKEDDFHKTALSISTFESSTKTSQEEIIEEVVETIKKVHPVYGDSDDNSTSDGDDRPLPFELKHRINKHIMKRAKNDPHDYKKEVNQSSTFNAYVRKQIRTGKI